MNFINKFAAFCLVFVVAVTALFFYLRVDDELSPLVERWTTLYQQTQQRPQSAAYLYLMGMMAAPEDDVLELGKKWYLEYKKTGNKNDAFDFYDKEKKLSLPDKSEVLFCDMKQPFCLNDIINNEALWAAELSKNSILLSRYNAYLEFEDFRSMTEATGFESYPNYAYIITGHRLKLIEALTIAKHNFHADAINLLKQDIRLLKHQIDVADTLVHKMVFAKLLSHDLDVITRIALDSGYRVELDIALLNQEIDMKAVMIREFMAIHKHFLDLSGAEEFTNDVMLNHFGDLLYKPNMTINSAIYPLFVAVRNSELGAEEFIRAIEAEDTPAQGSKWKNYMGHTLALLDSFDFNKYSARLHDINCKIALVNYFISGSEGSLVNPYYPKEIVVTKMQGQVCLGGPLDDAMQARCIMVE